jgi:uncharacterized protein involved in response to NO
MATGRGLPELLVIAIDLAFLPLLTLALAKALIASKNRKNYGFLFLLTALFSTNGVALLAPTFGYYALVSVAHQVALDLIVLIILVVGGRIIPLFTRNATGGAGIANHRALDLAAIGSMVLLTVLDALAHAPSLAGVAGVVALLTGGLTAARAWGWGARYARDPMLWVLHVGYFWVPIGLLLRGASRLTTAVPASAATHALTVGAIGTLTLGMMARVSLGHTGRVIRASRSLIVAFASVIGAAATRIAAAFLPTSVYIEALALSAGLWVLAFALFLVLFARVLLTPRFDGKPG